MKLVESGNFWITLWFVLNVGCALANKSLFHFCNFSYPLTLTIGHLSATSVFSALFVWMGWSRAPDENVLNRTKQWLMGLLLWSNIAVGNLSLKLESLALSQVVRAIIPGITMLLSYFILRSTYSGPTIASIALVIVGVVMTTYSDVNATAMGVAVLLFGSTLSALKGVMVKKYIGSIDSIYFLYCVAPCAVAQMCLYALVTGEFAEIHHRWHELNNMPNWILVVSTSILAFFLNYSNFMTNKLTSPLALTVGGNLKQVTTILLGIILFRTQVEVLMGVGIAVTVLGSIVYKKASDDSLKSEQKRITGGDPPV